MLLPGCASAPTAAPAPAQAAAPLPLDDLLARGDAARQDGRQDAARIAYREAARAHPADKQPWQRLAESYFQAGDYGNAVVAAQEAVLRDPKDHAAHSLLAVSGLRITAGSLNALREQSGYPAGSREEALEVTRRLREALNDPTLLTPLAAPPAAPAAAVRKPRPAAKAAAAPSPAPALAPVPAPRPSANPLDKLK